LTFLDLCKHPEAVCEVTLQPVKRFGVDAAIIFSDLLVVCEPMGLKLAYVEGEGPVIEPPLRRASEVERLRPVEPGASLGYVYEAIRLVRAARPREVPLIGFAGAPYTLASYLIEGRGSRTGDLTKQFMREEPKAWRRLMEKLTRVSADHLAAQIQAGADAVQLFDSWVGTLEPRDYETYVWPYSREVFVRLRSQISPPPQGRRGEERDPAAPPMIHFGTRTGPFLERFSDVGADVISVDSDIPLDEAWQRIGHKAIQGNLDPQVLLTDSETIKREAAKILDQAGGRPGHIFNLGHGVLPQTPPEHVQLLVEFVHQYSKR